MLLLCAVYYSIGIFHFTIGSDAGYDARNVTALLNVGELLESSLQKPIHLHGLKPFKNNKIKVLLDDAMAHHKHLLTTLSTYGVHYEY